MMTPMSREELLSLLTSWSEKNYTPPLDVNDLYDLVEPIHDLLAQARAEGSDKALMFMRKELHRFVRQCQAQNGLPYCKNCGLSDEILDGLVSQYHQGVTNDLL